MKLGPYDAFSALPTLIIFSLFPFLDVYLSSWSTEYSIIFGFTGLSIIASVSSITVIFFLGPKPFITKPEALFLSYLLLFSVIISVGISIGKNEETTTTHISAVIQLVGMYLVSKTIQVRYVKIFCIFMISFLSIVSLYTYNWYFIQPEHVSAAGHRIKYQAIALVFLVPATICAVLSEKIYTIPILFISVLTLFLIGARSEFIAYILTVPFIALSFRKIFFSVTITCVIAASVYLLRDISAIQQAVDASRIGNLLDIRSDNSYIMRMYMLKEAVQTISSNPFLGDYASYDPGDYAHNILSAWVDLGVFGLIMLLLVFFFSINLYKSIPNYFVDERLKKVSGILMMQVFILLIIAKVYFYPLTAFAVGFLGQVAADAARTRAAYRSFALSTRMT